MSIGFHSSVQAQLTQLEKVDDVAQACSVFFLQFRHIEDQKVTRTDGVAC